MIEGFGAAAVASKKSAAVVPAPGMGARLVVNHTGKTLPARTPVFVETAELTVVANGSVAPSSSLRWKTNAAWAAVTEQTTA